MQRGQPGLAILIGQRDAGMHLCLIGFGMEVVSVGKTPACLRSQQFADRGLARPGYSHEHKNHSFLLISCRKPAQWLPGNSLLYIVHDSGGLPVVTRVPAKDFAVWP